jgi:GNAT superfamily N-acetyltransferase
MNRPELRPVTPADGQAIADLLARSADSGAFQTSSRFKIDPWRALAAIHGEFDGVVAESGDTPGLVGCGLVRYGMAQLEGVMRPFALLNTLVVDPAHRRQGMAKELAGWRIAHARARIGPEGFVFAGIQGGNEGSVRTASRWCRQFVKNRVGVFPTPPMRRPPGARSPWRVREAEPRDLERIAEGLNASYRGFNFYAPESAASLADWHAETPVETPWRFMYVAEDAKGELVCGLSLAETGRIKSTRMVRMPVPIRILNHLVRLVPKDGLMQEVGVSRFWYRPGAEQAARRLWEVVRWEWRTRGNTFMLWSDPLAPLARLMKPLPWMPKSTGTLAIAAPVELDERRYLYPMM